MATLTVNSWCMLHKQSESSWDHGAEWNDNIICQDSTAPFAKQILLFQSNVFLLWGAQCSCLHGRQPLMGHI